MEVAEELSLCQYLDTAKDIGLCNTIAIKNHIRGGVLWIKYFCRIVAKINHMFLI